MKNLITFFVDNPKLASMFIFMMIAVGVLGLKTMNAETNPPVDFATAIITTNYPGASAKDIEAKITKPIEDEIKTVSDIKDIRSISQPGLSTIVVRIDMDRRGVIVPEVVSDLQKAVDRTADLPADLDSAPRFLELKSEEFPVMILAVTGGNENRERDIAADILKEEIEDNKAVKSISLDGYTERSFNIDLNPKKMLTHNIGVNEVLDKIASRNFNVPSGSLKSPHNQTLTRIEAKMSQIRDLKELVIRSNFSGKIVKLKDIADISDGKEELEVISRYNSQPATLLTINKKANKDTIKLVAQIEEKIARFQKRYQNSLAFHTILNEAQEVDSRLSILIGNIILGFAIILISLFVFLPLRIGMMTAISVPISILTTLGIMSFLGISLNTVTIIALVIVLGMLVDDSIVISEIFTRHRHLGKSPKESAILSVEKLWIPISATAFTTIAAFLPMLVTKGVMGRFIQWIPIIVTLALLISLFECFLLLPSRLSRHGHIKKSPQDSKNPGDAHDSHNSNGSNGSNENPQHYDWFGKFELKFEGFIYNCIKKRYLIVLLFFATIASSIFLIFFANKFILFPNEQTEVYVARFKTAKGTNLERSDRIASDVTKKIYQKFPDRIEHIMVKVGVSDFNAAEPKYSEGSNVGFFTIYVDEYTQNNVPHNRFINQLKEIDFTKDIKEITFEAQVKGPPVGNAIEATFRSNSFSDIDGIIALIKGDLGEIDGIYDLKTDDVIGENEIFITIDYDKADRLGLTVDMVGRTIKTAIAGTIASKVTIDNKDVNIFVRFKKDSRQSLKDLKRVRIMDKAGNLIPLTNIATFKTSDGSPFIKRYDYRRAKTLFGDIDENKITSIEANSHLRKSFKEHSAKFPSVSLSFGGAAESTDDSMASLGNAFILSIIGIFGLLVLLFKSYLKPLIILTTIPLGLFGFSLAFYLHQKPVSFMSIIGIVGLGGVIVNSGIILISYILKLQKDHPKTPLPRILAHAASMRLRSITVTSFTTIAGLAPTSYGIGGKDAILSPLTLSMMWGLAGGTFLTLIWIPCAYTILDDISHLTTKILGIFKRKDIKKGINKLSRKINMN